MAGSRSIIVSVSFIAALGSNNLYSMRMADWHQIPHY